MAPVLPEVKAGSNAITIVNVRAYIIESKYPEQAGGGFAEYHSQSEGHWILGTKEWSIAKPMCIYEKYKSRRIVEIELTNGIKSVGVSIGDESACFIIGKHFSRFLERQDLLSTSL
jgi:L-rhamnonate dehydratase